MRLYTAEEAAEILSLSKWTVWKYGREGKLKTVRFGRTVRYELEGSHESDESDRKYHRTHHRDGNAHGDRCGNRYSNCSKLGG